MCVGSKNIILRYVFKQKIWNKHEGLSESRQIYSSMCQKLKHFSVFIVYNDAHYHISSLLSSSQMGKVNKPGWPMYRAETDLGERDYITREREEEENQRERTSYIDYL